MNFPKRYELPISIACHYYNELDDVEKEEFLSLYHEMLADEDQIYKTFADELIEEYAQDDAISIDVYLVDGLYYDYANAVKALLREGIYMEEKFKEVREIAQHKIDNHEKLNICDLIALYSDFDQVVKHRVFKRSDDKIEDITSEYDVNIIPDQYFVIDDELQMYI